MYKLEKIFIDKTKEISFIELKEDASFNLNGYIINGGTPLPIITEDLIEGIKYSDISNELNLVQIIDGIIFLLGIDSSFPYIDVYKNILFAYDKKAEDYVFYKGMMALDNKDFINRAVFFRANIVLNSNNVKARLNYGLALDLISKDCFEKDQDEAGINFLNKSTNEFETILEIDNKYSLAYYKLGYHYRRNEQFLKAKLTWDKFLLLDKDANRLQEIREQVDLIGDEVKLEVGLTYLNNNDFGKALDSLLKLLSNNKKNWNVNYLIGLCYRGLENYQYAVEYLNYALELNRDQSDIYNELGITYFIQEKIMEALSVFNEGIENSADDYKLFFNRGLAFIQLAEHKRALNDVNKAYELNPKDENIIKQKSELENYIRLL